MADRLPYPLARVGIIGGGQLARMLVQAASRIGCDCVILDPQPGSPAGQLAQHQIIGDYHDPAKLTELAGCCDVITFDLEDIDTETLIALHQDDCRIFPSPQLLRTVQDKLLQKTRFVEAGIPTAEFVEVGEATAAGFAAFGYPLVQKARRGGYDGRGVAVIRDAEGFEAHLKLPSLIERFIEADKELAVLVARGIDGQTRCYPAVEMVFHAGENVLDMLLAPADIGPEVATAAEQLAVRTVEALDGVGIFGVELFLTADGGLLVNEVAPRTHNSGHHTIEACVTDQFEQHLRAVIGLPLGDTRLLSPAAMINLLGDPDSHGPPAIEGMAAAMAIPGVSVHLYGKMLTTPFRKMGHVTVLDTDLDRARDKAEQVRGVLKIVSEQQL